MVRPEAFSWSQIFHVCGRMLIQASKLLFCNDLVSTPIAEKASSLAMTAPTRLSGVEAPDVRPIVTGPDAGSQPAVRTSFFVPAGRWRISAADIRHPGSAM